MFPHGRFPRIPLWLALLPLVAIVCFALWRQGVKLSPDSQTYSLWADQLIADHFNFKAAFAKLNFPVVPYNYALWVAYVAVHKLLFGNAWSLGVVIGNVLALGLTTWLLVRLLKALECPNWGIALGLLAMAGVHEYSFWANYALSDVSFVALLTLWLVILLGSRQWWPLLPLGAVLLAYRPPAIVLLPLVAVAFAAGHLAKAEPTQRPLKLWALVAGLAALALVLTGLHASIVADPSRWPFDGGRGWVSQLAEMYQRGIIVHDRPSTYVTPPESWLGYLGMTLRKFLYFWSPSAPEFSFAHKAINWITLLPLYLLAGFAVWRAFSIRQVMSAQRWRAVVILSAWCLGLALFHALQVVDYDFRYRLPTIPAVLVLAVIGLTEWRRNGQNTGA